MTLDTRPNLNDDKFEQYSDDQLNLSGITNIHNTIDIKSGGTIGVQSGGTIGVQSGGTIGVQSGGTIGVQSGGTIGVQSGGTLDVQSDGVFNVQSGGTINIQKGNVFEDNVLTSDGSGNVSLQEPNKNIPIGLEGEVLYYNKDNVKDFENDFTLKYATIVESDEELEIATGSTPTFETIFNEWDRFSHYYKKDYSDIMDITNFSPYYPYKQNPLELSDPPTYEEQDPNYPAYDPDNPTYPLNENNFQDAWDYDSTDDRIYLTDNFNPYTGFISKEKYDSYNLKVTLSSDNNDDDVLAVVIAFVTGIDPDTDDQFEFTISVIRKYVPDSEIPAYGIIYNYLQNTKRSDYYTSDFDYVSEEFIADGSSLVTTSGDGWDVAGQTVMEVIREGDIITTRISQQGDSSIDPNTELSIDLKDYSKLHRFRGPAKFGFGAQSQANAYFSDLEFSGFGNYIFYTKNNGNSHDTYEFDQDTSTWFLQDPQDLTLQDYVGKGRFVHTDNFKRTYYSNPNGNITNLVPSTGETITTADNGLVTNNGKVELGGSLCRNTVISGLDTNNLEFSGGTLQYSSDYSNIITARSIPDAAWVTGNTTSDNYYLCDASFDTGNGELTLTVNGATDQVVDLDGRYCTSDTNYYLSDASFDTGNGELTLCVNGASNQVVDLDGRYCTSDTNYYVDGVSGSGNGTLTICVNGASNQSTDLSHTHDSRYYTESQSNSRYVRKDTYQNNSFQGDYLIWNDGGTDNRDFIAFNDSDNSFYFNADTSLTDTSANATVCVRTLCGGTVCATSRSCSSVHCSTYAFRTSGDGLRFCGSGDACGCAADWIATSDICYKKNIEPITGALSKVNSLCGVCYNLCGNNSADMGLIAQDVEKIEPRLVTKNEPSDEDREKYNIKDEVYGLKYDKFAGLFVEAIKELKKENEQLKNEINNIKQKIE